MARTVRGGTVAAVSVLRVLSIVLLAVGYVGVPAAAAAAFASAVTSLPHRAGRRWYGRRHRDLWRAWRSGEVSEYEYRVGAPATWLRPAWRSLLVTVPCFAAGFVLGLVSGTVT